MMKRLKYIFPVLLFYLLSTYQLQAQTTSKIKVDQLPETAQVQLNKKYNKYKINSLVKNEDKQKKITFEVEVQKKNTVFALIYNENGVLLNKTKSKSFSFDGTEPIRNKTPASTDGHNHKH